MPTPLPNSAPELTALTDDHLDAIRADTHSRRNRFVDPTRLAPVQATLARLPQSWIAHVLGHPVADSGIRQWGTMVALADAAELDHIHLAYLAGRDDEERTRRLDRERAEAQHRAAAKRQQWDDLRRRLPVDVFVGLNWAYGYENGSNRGRSHIVVQRDLCTGRLRRSAETALCETPSRTRPGVRGLNPMRALDRAPRDGVVPGDFDRVPDCRACLAIADRIAAQQTDGAVKRTDDHNNANLGEGKS